MKTSHEIHINRNAQEIFSELINVDKWDTIFPPCVYSEELFFLEGRQKIRLFAKAGDDIFSWKSVRVIDSNNMEIKFTQTQKKKLIEFMEGKWHLINEDGGCRAILDHEFDVKKDYDCSEGNKGTALSMLCKAVDDNSIKELAALKEVMEDDSFYHEFSITKELNFPAKMIFPFLKRLDIWKVLLPHCEGIEIIYDDDNFQIFTMTVSVNNNIEKIRSIRVIDHDVIRYFQPEPPYPLEKHSGKWTLESKTDKTLVTSYHKIKIDKSYTKDINELESIKTKAEVNINNNSSKTINSINEMLERLANEQ